MFNSFSSSNAYKLLVNGTRSSTAKNYLIQMGYENVNDLGSFKNYNYE